MRDFSTSAARALNEQTHIMRRMTRDTNFYVPRVGGGGGGRCDTL